MFFIRTQLFSSLRKFVRIDVCVCMIVTQSRQNGWWDRNIIWKWGKLYSGITYRLLCILRECGWSRWQTLLLNNIKQKHKTVAILSRYKIKGRRFKLRVVRTFSLQSSSVHYPVKNCTFLYKGIPVKYLVEKCCKGLSKTLKLNTLCWLMTWLFTMTGKT